MTELSTIELCGEGNVFWYAGREPARCVDPAHEHQRFEIHRHLDVVTLPDGTDVVAASFDPLDPYERERPPAVGLYLDERWDPPWPHEHVDWPDFGVPDDPAALAAALRPLLEVARRGDGVEIGCVGGHGRTGTALACLAVLSGADPADAVEWVRTRYCAGAIETPEQEAFVAAFPG